MVAVLHVLPVVLLFVLVNVKVDAVAMDVCPLVLGYVWMLVQQAVPDAKVHVIILVLALAQLLVPMIAQVVVQEVAQVHVRQLAPILAIMIVMDVLVLVLVDATVHVIILVLLIVLIHVM